jgi:hypothetical protein
VQNNTLKNKLDKEAHPFRWQIETATRLLTYIMIQHNIYASFLTPKHLQAYVTYISNVVYAAQSRYQFLQMVDELSLQASQITAKQLSNELFMSFEEDSWSRFNKHYCPVTTGCHGASTFAGAFGGVVELL